MQLTIIQQSFRVVIDNPPRDFYVTLAVKALTQKARSLEEAKISLGLNNLTPYLEVQIHQANIGRRMNKNPTPGSNQLAAGEWVAVPQKTDTFGWRSNLKLGPSEYLEPNGLEATITAVVKSLLERSCGLTKGKITLKEKRSESKMSFGPETKKAFP